MFLKLIIIYRKCLKSDIITYWKKQRKFY